MTDPVIDVQNLSKAYRIGLKEEIPDTLTGALTGWIKAPLRNWRRLRRLNTFREPAESGQLSAVGSQQNEKGGRRSEDGGQNWDTTHHSPPTNHHSPNPQSPIPNPQSDTVWALRDVSFEVHEGEVVGIIGRNGAGKSTLLKVLSRITEPTSGRAVIRGRVGSLLEVGTGFHPELTGRENVYMNGTILGMRKREIDRKFDEIVDFSGVEKFLDTPIKRYSSGMQVRLAFAVAAHLDPEILIVDEVLAVGDAEFQKKCLGKMQDVASEGRTVLFVSHNMAAVESLCRRGICISQGSVAADSRIQSCVTHYMRSSLTHYPDATHCFTPENDLHVNNPYGFSIEQLIVSSEDNVAATGYPVGAPLELTLDCASSAELNDPGFLVQIRTASGILITDLHNKRSGSGRARCRPGRFSVKCVVRDLSLVPGEYTLRVAVKISGEWIFISDCAGRITILPADVFGTGKLNATPESLIVARQQWAITARTEHTQCISENCETN